MIKKAKITVKSIYESWCKCVCKFFNKILYGRDVEMDENITIDTILKGLSGKGIAKDLKCAGDKDYIEKIESYINKIQNELIDKQQLRKVIAEKECGKSRIDAILVELNIAVAVFAIFSLTLGLSGKLNDVPTCYVLVMRPVIGSIILGIFCILVGIVNSPRNYIYKLEYLENLLKNKIIEKI